MALAAALTLLLGRAAVAPLLPAGLQRQLVSPFALYGVRLLLGLAARESLVRCVQHALVDCMLLAAAAGDPQTTATAEVALCGWRLSARHLLLLLARFGLRRGRPGPSRPPWPASESEGDTATPTPSSLLLLVMELAALLLNLGLLRLIHRHNERRPPQQPVGGADPDGQAGDAVAAAAAAVGAVAPSAADTAAVAAEARGMAGSAQPPGAVAIAAVAADGGSRGSSRGDGGGSGGTPRGRDSGSSDAASHQPTRGGSGTPHREGLQEQQATATAAMAAAAAAVAAAAAIHQAARDVGPAAAAAAAGDVRGGGDQQQRQQGPPQLLPPPFVVIAGGSDGGQQQLPPYRPFIKRRAVRVKMPWAEPEDLGPDFQGRLRQLVADRGLHLAWTYVRRGCVELTLVLEAPAAPQRLQSPPPGPPTPEASLPGSCAFSACAGHRRRQQQQQARCDAPWGFGPRCDEHYTCAAAPAAAAVEPVGGCWRREDAQTGGADDGACRGSSSDGDSDGSGSVLRRLDARSLLQALDLAGGGGTDGDDGGDGEGQANEGAGDAQESAAVGGGGMAANPQPPQQQPAVPPPAVHPAADYHHQQQQQRAALLVEQYDLRTGRTVARITTAKSSRVRSGSGKGGGGAERAGADGGVAVGSDAAGGSLQLTGLWPRVVLLSSHPGASRGLASAAVDGAASSPPAGSGVLRAQVHLCPADGLEWPDDARRRAPQQQQDPTPPQRRQPQPQRRPQIPPPPQKLKVEVLVRSSSGDDVSLPVHMTGADVPVLPYCFETDIQLLRLPASPGVVRVEFSFAPSPSPSCSHDGGPSAPDAPPPPPPTAAPTCSVTLPLLATDDPGVARELAAAAAAWPAATQHELDELLYDMGTWAAAAAAPSSANTAAAPPLPAARLAPPAGLAATAACSCGPRRGIRCCRSGGGGGSAVCRHRSSGLLGAHLLSYAEAAGWAAVANWIRSGLA